jgi:hypothetical protein
MGLGPSLPPAELVRQDSVIFLEVFLTKKMHRTLAAVHRRVWCTFAVHQTQCVSIQSR